MISISAIEQALRSGAAVDPADSGKVAAAVAIVLRSRHDEVELLYIQRTHHPQDPWSGHIAFPGGRREAGDATLRQTAVRETREEVGLDLTRGRYLGHLETLDSASLSVSVTGYVYTVAPAVAVTANPKEVQTAFWVPVSVLLQPERHCTRTFSFRGLEKQRMPALDLLGPDGPLLWGLTYRFTARLLRLAGHELPDAQADS